MPVKTRVTGRSKTIKPSSEEFARTVNAIPNSERLKQQYNPVVFYDKPKLGAGKV